MANYVKYNVFVEDLTNKVHDLFGTNDTLKVALTNAAPNVATHTVLADITEITAGGGYSAGGSDTQNDGTRASGTLTVAGVDVVLTGSGGGFGPFRYVVLYNSTPAGGPLIAYWDYASSISVLAGETFTIDFAANTLLTLT